MRSKLFVPGSRPELFSKALASEADGLSIDLEDAVVDSRKAEARDTVRTWLKNLDGAKTNKLIIVRVNAMDTPYFAQDIESVVQTGLDVVNLPKPANVDAVREAVQAVKKAEKANGVAKPVRLLLNIESPQALRQAAELARSDTRVMGLQVGLGDLFEPLSIDRRDVAAVHHVLLTVRLAAGEAGIDAYDGAFAHVGDTEGFMAEAAMARRLGLSGKSCIHPSQIAMANQAFRPSDAEIRHALNVVRAATEHDTAGRGAFLVDGRMIDKPFLIRAQSIVALAKRLNIQPTS